MNKPPWIPITNGSILKLLEGAELYDHLEEQLRLNRLVNPDTAWPPLALSTKGREEENETI